MQAAYLVVLIAALVAVAAGSLYLVRKLSARE